MTSERPESEQGETPTPAAIAATEHPVHITVALVEDQRVPDGMVCMGSYRNGRLVARAVLPPEAWGQITEYGIFDEPVQIVLVARAAPPGLQCQLYAMVPLPDDEDDHECDCPRIQHDCTTSPVNAVERDGVPCGLPIADTAAATPADDRHPHAFSLSSWPSAPPLYLTLRALLI